MASIKTIPQNENSCVKWDYHGPTDALVGSGASKAEQTLAYGMATVLASCIFLLDQMKPHPITGESWLLRGILLFFSFDIAGGAVANMLNSCKRFYHSPLKEHEGSFAKFAKNVRLFTAIHVHPIILSWCLGGNIHNSFFWYMMLQVAVWMTLAVPLYLRRSFATGLTVLAIIFEPTMPLGDGLSWFIPCLFIKMVVGHAVQEEPYGPKKDT